MKLNSENSVEHLDGSNGFAKPLVTCRCNSLELLPINLKEANAFVQKFHRHHKPVTGAKFWVGIFCKCCGDARGVAICGRPISRRLDDKRTVEVLRLCVKDETPNGCSMLYAACSRIAKEMGYSKILTYILMSEAGTSLKASGWDLEAANVGGTSWNSSGNIIRTAETVDLFGTYKKYPAELKQRWSKVLRNGR